MKSIQHSAFILFIFTFLCNACVHAQKSRIPDFALYDQNAMFHQLSRIERSAFALLVVQSNGDPESQRSLKELAKLSARYNSKKIHVFGLNTSGENSISIQSELSSIDVKLPVLMDKAGIVARSLKASSTGEAFLISIENMELLYQGPVFADAITSTENSPLENTILKAIAGNLGETINVPHTTGIKIDPNRLIASGAEDISYSSIIAPIFKRRCVACHVEDGLAPWAMDSHRMIQGWSPMIREVLMTRRMPPGQIDMEIGSWHNDTHQITDQELALLVYWIDKGALKEESDADPLLTSQSSSAVWPEGIPDLIVDLPENNVPATGTVDFIYSRIPLALDKDQWVSAVSYNIGGVSVLHSLIINATSTNSDDSAILKNPMANSDFISLYVPGQTIDRFTTDSGFLLKKDRELIIKTRYLSSGRQTIDRSQLGFYFLDSAPTYAIQPITLESLDFLLPAGTSDVQISTLSEPLSFDARLESISPLMHSRGKGVSIYKVSQNGNRDAIFSMPNYNYNWQMTYRLNEAMDLKAGTILQALTVYDNSLANPFNLDPSSNVLQGPTENDETLTHYIRLLKKLTNERRQ